MNTYKQKTVAVTVSIIVGLCTAPSAIATNTGLQTLGTPANSIDVFTFTCPAGSGPRARVNDSITPSPVGVSMQAVLGQNSVPTVQVTDTSDDGLPSAWTSIIPVAGPHVVAFKKTGAAAESYNGEIQCCTSSAVCSNTAGNLLIRQINQ